MKILICFLTVLSFSANADQTATEDCSGVLTPSAQVASLNLKAGAFELDTPTVKDLGLEDLTFPTLAKYLVTEIGKLRLKAMLSHPLIDSEAIRERQSAVQFLIAHPELREKIKALLKTAQKSYASDSPDHLKEIGKRYLPGSWLPYFATSAGASAVTGLAAYAALDHEGYRYIGAVLMPVLMFGGQNNQDLGWVRARIKPLKSVVAMAEQLHADLTATPSSVLRGVGNTLSAVDDPEHSLQLSKVSQNIRRMITNPIITTLAGVTYTLNAPTHALRGEVLRNQEGLSVLLSAMADLDVLVGFAELYEKNREHYSFPTILATEQDTYLKIVDGHHPYVLDQLNEYSVPNSIEMRAGPPGADQPPSFLLLTGPNTGGKSTFLRMLSTNLVLAQIGAPVAAKNMTLTPMSLMTNMNVQDALNKSQSFFYAQADRVEKILATAAKQKHMLIVMDEILNGTSPEEHTAIERAIIKYLVNSKYLSILATHDRKLQSMEAEVPGVVNIHVDDKSKDTFVIKNGPSQNRNAVQVIDEVGFPKQIIDEAKAYLSNMGI